MDDIGFSYADPRTPLLQRRLIQLVEAATGQRRLQRIYLEQQRSRQADESFFEAAVRLLTLDVRFEAAALAAVPRTGPLVVVANHPYGVLDGIVISWLMEKVRGDFRVMTNAVLLRAPELQPFVLPVDFSGTPEASRTNIASRAAARAHLEAGGCMVVFPAGGVSTAPDRLGRRPAVDAPWQAFASQLVQRSGATVVPVYFAGQNSRAFQIASHLSLTLRIALIFREVKLRMGTGMAVAVGAPIPFSDLRAMRDRQVLADHLRARTYALMDRAPPLPREPGTSRGPRVARSGGRIARGSDWSESLLHRSRTRDLGVSGQPRPR